MFLHSKVDAETATELKDLPWEQFALDYQKALGTKKRSGRQLRERSEYLSRQLQASSAGSHASDSMRSKSSLNLSLGGPKLRRRKTSKYPFGEDPPDDKLYPHSGKVDFRILDSIKRSTSGPEPEPEGELAPEPGPEQIESRIPTVFQREVQADRARCIQMLRNLADTLEQEYRDGGRAHWGSEDRRTKMVFVTLNRSLLYKIIGVIVGQFLAALLGGAYKYMVAT